MAEINFDGNTPGSLATQATNAYGLTGTWAANSGINATVTAGNIAFSTLNPGGVGNRLVISPQTSANIAAELNLSMTLTGTLWYSGIFVVERQNSTGSNYSEISRIGNASNTTAANTRLRVMPDSNSSTTGLEHATAISYANQTSTTAATSTPSLNVPYLVISRFTNVNTTLGSGVNGVATMYVLTVDQYDTFALSSTPETYLDSTAVGTGNSQIFGRVSSGTVSTGSYAFADANFLQISGLGAFNDAFVGDYDFIHYGDSLSAVLPEPAGLCVLAMAGGMLVKRKRRLAGPIRSEIQ